VRQITSAHKRSATYLGLDASWMAKAECKHQGFDEPHRRRNIDMFFSERNRRKIMNAKLMCAECPVRSECLQYALRVPFDNGVWGGLTPNERIRVRRGERTPDHFWSEVPS
jgi:WhiB family redox-sensing transcriptional regulator